MNWIRNLLAPQGESVSTPELGPDQVAVNSRDLGDLVAIAAAATEDAWRKGGITEVVKRVGAETQIHADPMAVMEWRSEIRGNREPR